MGLGWIVVEFSVVGAVIELGIFILTLLFAFLLRNMKTSQIYKTACILLIIVFTILVIYSIENYCWEYPISSYYGGGILHIAYPDIFYRFCAINTIFIIGLITTLIIQIYHLLTNKKRTIEE